MEGGEELSEAPQSDSGLREPCKVEESFRSGRGFYLKPSVVSESNKLIFQLHSFQLQVSVHWSQFTLSRIYAFAFEPCCWCLISCRLCRRSKHEVGFARLLSARWIKLLNAHQMRWGLRNQNTVATLRKAQRHAAHPSLQKRAYCCSAIAQVFNGPNRELFYNGIMHVFWAQSSFVDRLGNSV